MATHSEMTEAIRASLAEVFDGRIHTYRRWSVNIDEMHMLYRPEGAEGAGALKAAVITREANAVGRDSESLTGDRRADTRKHTYVVELSYGWSDADATETIVQALVDTIIAHFDTEAVRARFHAIDAVLHPMSAQAILTAQSKAGGVLFHAVRLVLPVIEL